MHKILYLSFNPPYQSIGVYKKELEFCKSAFEYGNSKGILFKGANFFPSIQNVPVFYPLPSHDYFELHEMESSLLQRFFTIKYIRSIFRANSIYRPAYSLIDKFKPDIVLFRYTYAVPSTFNPKKVAKNILFLTEHQTKELEEIKFFSRNKVLWWWERNKRKKLFGLVDGIIGVTSEITEYQSTWAPKALPRFVLTNSCRVDSYPKRIIPPLQQPIKMIFPNTTSDSFRGLERVLQGISQSQYKKNIELHIIGTLSKNTLKKIEHLRINDQVVFHGFLKQRSLNLLYNEMHIGIANLGLHRIGLTQGSTLKVREYMARGIPFILSHNAEDLGIDYPFRLSIPADDSPLAILDVLHFLKNIYAAHGNAIAQTMRSDAKNTIDYSIKVPKYLDFLINLTR